MIDLVSHCYRFVHRFVGHKDFSKNSIIESFWWRVALDRWGHKVNDVLRLIWCVVIPSINLTVSSNQFACFNLLPKQIQTPAMSFLTSRNTNEDTSPSNDDPSTPSSNLPKRISYLRKTNILQHSIHVSFKPFASLRSPHLVIYETIS